MRAAQMQKQLHAARTIRGAARTRSCAARQVAAATVARSSVLNAYGDAGSSPPDAS